MSAEPRTAEPVVPERVAGEPIAKEPAAARAAVAGSRGAPLSLRAQLREDRDVHYGSRLHPGYQALAVHRFGRWCRERGGLVGRFGTIAFKAVNNIVIRNLQGTEISVDASIGRRVLIGHHQAVMIPRYCVIGDDTIIRHGVTIGYASTDAPPDAVPKIGARVDIAPGAHLIGPITIGDDVKIGPGSIVTTDVPAGATVFAAPARIMRPPAG